MPFIMTASLLPYFTCMSHCSVFKVHLVGANAAHSVSGYRRKLRIALLLLLFLANPFTGLRSDLGTIFPASFEARFEDLIFRLGLQIQQQMLFGGPEWARTTDLAIISRTL